VGKKVNAVLGTKSGSQKNDVGGQRGRKAGQQAGKSKKSFTPAACKERGGGTEDGVLLRVSRRRGKKGQGDAGQRQGDRVFWLRQKNGSWELEP